MSRSAKGKRARRRVRTPAGASPGTLAIEPGAPSPELRGYRYGPERLVEETLRVDQLGAMLEARPRPAVTWVEVTGLGDATVLQAIGDRFGVHRLALADVAHTVQRPKVEVFPSQLFIVARAPHRRNLDPLETLQVSLVLGTDSLLSFEESKECGAFEPVKERLRSSRGKIRELGPDYLAYALLDAVLDLYFPLLEAAGERLETLEDEILSQPSRGTIARLHAEKRELIALRRAVWPLREALNVLIRDPTPLVSDASRLYFRDSYDHAVQVIDLIETYRELASDLVDVYLSSVNNRMSEVMKVLTIIATTFIPITFVAGVYGMNFQRERSPYNMPELGWYYGYPFALGLMALIAGGMLLFFKRKGWLDKP
jgi:magnesium transporter